MASARSRAAAHHFALAPPLAGRSGPRGTGPGGIRSPPGARMHARGARKNCASLQDESHGAAAAAPQRAAWSPTPRVAATEP
eukprot:CAMPEP_0179372458 /NCGR_PEP_ID=MMETSP0797-20121207/86295_1 /TAXON_ID=47934 /ORGANISM="Dinophysis acuminata, Strain DAEP01" /LENGTH=81 /DNA_ID=CAMNT_0021088429 /DNA_START=34 /DNA_END=279 /DNA_ORIENTATION=+